MSKLSSTATVWENSTKGGKESLKSAEDLPLPLQRVYETFWTDCLSVPCYIAYVDGRPGLLLAAEYNDELCDEESIPHDYFLKYEVLCDRSTKLEMLVQTLTATAEVGIGVDTAPIRNSWSSFRHRLCPDWRS